MTTKVQLVILISQKKFQKFYVKVKEWGYMVFLKLFFRQGFSQNFSTPRTFAKVLRVITCVFYRIVLSRCLLIS
jgi:hypothetical protein